SGTFTQEAAKSSNPIASSSILPPAYTRNIESFSSIDQNNNRPVNCLYIREKREPIRGAWTIDPAIRIPPGLLAGVKSKKRMDNLNLYSWEQIQALLTLASGTPTKSHLVVESHQGMVQVDIVSRLNQRFHLTASSKHGPATIYLPRDFEGPITFKYSTVQPYFSEQLLARMTLFGRDNKQGTAFVGDWSQFGDGKRDKNGKYEHWNGDELVVSTRRYGARICYSDEPREVIVR
ncbi:hypothetical protein FRB97_004103, partial [Tulasnella sp. 331]